MKRKDIERLKPTGTRKKGWIATVQQVGAILVLNLYENKRLQGRYCMDSSTHEYQGYDYSIGKWTGKKLMGMIGLEAYNYSTYRAEKKLQFNSEKEEQLIIDLLTTKECDHEKTAISIIDYWEYRTNQCKRERAEQNRYARVRGVMQKVPKAPEGLTHWIYEKAAGDKDYAFLDKKQDRWFCTACEKRFCEKYMHRIDGGEKIRHNDMVKCPRCKKVIQVKKRSQKQELMTQITLLQAIDEEMSVARHIEVEIQWDIHGRRTFFSESIRIILHKMTGKKKYACDLYYNQYSRSMDWREGSLRDRDEYFDNKSNNANRRLSAGYLYEAGIKEALENTCYLAWIRLFEQMAAAGKKANYNKLMIAQNNLTLIGLTECLFKGRFDKLLLETSEYMSPWSCDYCGPLKQHEKTIEGVFDIHDRQKINRIRELDGGEKVLKWMRWSDSTGERIPQEVLEWLATNGVETKEIKFLEKYKKFSIQKIMNYVIRQQEGGYKSKSVKQVLSQWGDYLDMCERQNKKMDDEMVYKPRELKRRHDEIVEEIRKQQMIEDMKSNRERQEQAAKEMRDKFPGAEENLEAVRHKFEYENDRFKIIVPQKLIQIMEEGHALHHCVASTDRYFDRIMQHETYVCFLRCQLEPDTPYYTIEIEPGGTIRQSRGYLDEEPGIEEIRPFLREWQQVIKKRMKSKDYEQAEVSAKKREKNIEELKQKNNIRVLNGLMEDFMEAM